MITERLSRRRQIAEAVAVLAIVATSVGVAAFKYNETEAEIRRATVEATINPNLIGQAVKSVDVDPAQVLQEKETLAKYSFDPLPADQITDPTELYEETKRRISSTLHFMEESQIPIFNDAYRFIHRHLNNDVFILFQDSVPRGKSPMYIGTTVNLDGLAYAINVSKPNAVYDLNTVGMALELTRQTEYIKDNMEYAISNPALTMQERVNVEEAYLRDQREMAERQTRGDGIMTQALIHEAALGYTGPVHADIQTDATRFLDSYGNPFVQ
ncbi:MAG: hypothetical protein UR81_C0004G0010 [Candidatus Levybacteria bacterium GW2011_GWB1_35_5]|nr:MAG: hypothetical protein UR81_C0004G0010 [Candidatus Levybacteria bacterium GW2011_GWB1_35_5]